MNSQLSIGIGCEPHSLQRWLEYQALPLWFTEGCYENGSFAESLTADKESPAAFQRARVATRQIFVLAEAGKFGWAGPWRRLLDAGIRRYWSTFQMDAGDFRTLVDLAGQPLDDTTWLYDQAFSLLAMAAAAEAGVHAAECRSRALALLARLDDRRASAGGWKEAGEHTYQANAHMHLLEAFLAWAEIDQVGPWMSEAGKVVDMAINHFIDHESGALHEFFDAHWTRLRGADGGLIEPGHQFEWAWLLVRYSRHTGDDRAMAAAHGLYAVGAKGILSDRGVACDELADDLSVRSGRARLWPQTEWLKAALILEEETGATSFGVDVNAACKALAGYLTEDGRWWDKQIAANTYLNEPAPASSLYHIVGALAQLRRMRPA